MHIADNFGLGDDGASNVDYNYLLKLLELLSNGFVEQSLKNIGMSRLKNKDNR